MYCDWLMTPTGKNRLSLPHKKPGLATQGLANQKLTRVKVCVPIISRSWVRYKEGWTLIRD